MISLCIDRIVTHALSARSDWRLVWRFDEGGSHCEVREGVPGSMSLKGSIPDRFLRPVSRRLEKLT
jgi:hypothetical protein